MTDHDRGAYTPQPDAPLQFDARGPRGRKPMPMTLIGSGAVLVVVLGALAMHYRHDTGKDGVRPVGEPVAQVKAAAPASAQPKEAGVDVLNAASVPAAQTAAQAPAKTPNFLPPPEAPKPRAQLTVQTDETTAPVKSLPTTNITAPAAKPAPTTLAKALPVYHAPGVASAAITAPVTAAAAAKAAPPAVIKPVTVAKPVTLASTKLATPVAPAKPTALAIAKPIAMPAKSGAAVVQIGAFSSTSQSDSGFAAVSSVMAGEMGGKAKRVETVEVGGKTYFRTSVTGFSTRNAADAFCRALAAKGHTCFAKG